MQKILELSTFKNLLLCYKLGNYPTPLQQWNFSWKGNSHQFWIKRDDLTDMVANGNKIRKLEFILPEVILSENTHDCILSLGPSQSNSCRVITALAPRLGLKSAHVLVETNAEKLNNDQVKFTEGNLFFHNLFGAKLFFVSREEYRSRGMDVLLEEAKEKLVKGGDCLNPYILPMGGSTIQGVFGYIEGFKEIEEQVVTLNLDIEEIVFACGSGGTAAGLAIGKFLSKSKLRNVKLIGCIVWECPGGVDHFYKYVNDTLRQLGLVDKVRAEELIEFVEAQGKGYGDNSKEELDLIRDVASSSGIVLDGTYTVKALQAYLTMSKDDMKGKDGKCLFLHTGGIFSLIGRNEYIK